MAKLTEAQQRFVVQKLACYDSPQQVSDGASQYQAGADAKQTEIEKGQAAIERAWQEERDRADAQYREAVLARQQTESKLAQAERDRDAAFARINGLRKQLAVRGAEGAGPDWIGLF